MALTKNILVHGAASSVTVIALFFVHVVAGRYLGAEQYGLLSFGIAFAAMFLAVFDPGMQQLMVRELARDRSMTAKYVTHAVVYKLLAFPFALAIGFAILWVILDTNLAIGVSVVMFVSMWLNSMKDSMRPVFVAFERFDLNARILIFERFGLLFAVGLVCYAGLGLPGVMFAFVVWRLTDLIYTASVMKKHLVAIKPIVNFPFLRRMLIQAVPIGAFYLTNYVYNYLDTIMIGAFRQAEEIGWYSAAYRLYEGFLIVPAVISSVLMPRISRAYTNNKNELTKLAQIGSALSLLSGLACAAGITLFGRWAIALFYGHDFAQSAPTLVVLGFGIAFAFIAQFLQTLLISIHRQKEILWCALGGLVFNGSLNLYLIPKYGQVGAAWATVVSLIVVLIGLLFVMYRAWRHIRTETGDSTGSKSQ